jgi:hypothetical protein
MSRRSEESAITLRALDGAPLADDALRDMVVATAHGIAERQGVEVVDVDTTPESITVRLCCGRIEALGLAVELRRLTTTWYTRKYGAPTLWGDPPVDDEGWGEA